MNVVTLVMIVLGAILIQGGSLITRTLKTWIRLGEINGTHFIKKYEIYDAVMNGSTVILQFLEYTVLLYCINIYSVDFKRAWKFLGCSLRQRTEEASLQSEIKESWKEHTIQRLILLLLLFLLIVLTPVLPALGFYRDLQILFEVKYCSLPTNLTSCLLTIILVLTSELLTFCNILVNLTIRMLMTGLVWSYVSKWDTNTREIKELDNTINEMQDISSLVRSKQYFFYSRYQNVGKKTEGMRKVLESWFVMQYFVFLLYTFISAIHALRPAFNSEVITDVWDIIFYSLFVFYNLTSLLVPYLLAIWMTDAHRSYYKELTEKYLLGSKVMSGVDLTCGEKSYVSEALLKKIELHGDFDICPKILDVSIPIYSPGYTAAILIALFSLVESITI